MASINKLSIRGIRSFSPAQEELIEFYSPITMIVGENGCGKTTVIECLKYACTGILPPGAKNGHSFVNDPSMTDATEVKASIRLKFKNKRKLDELVSRSFQLTKKRSKVEFKAVDGVIKHVLPDGTKESITQKCSDLDKIVPELMGVSSAILENVVFCHQEDSCWPLSEGAQLKKRFDDIFESTRYSKALEAIQKSKKDYASKAKDIKVDVAESAAHLKSAQEMRRILEAQCMKRDEHEKDMEALGDELQRQETKIENCQTIVRRWESAQREVQNLQTDAENLRRRIADKRSSLEVEYSEPDEYLNNQIDNFDSEIQKKQQNLQKMQRAVDATSSDIQKLRSEIDKLNAKLGEARSLEQQFSRQKDDQSEVVVSVVKAFGLTAPKDNFGSHFDTFMRNVNTKLAEASAASDSAITEWRSRTEKSSLEVQTAKGNIQKLQLESASKDKEITTILAELSTLREEQLASEKRSLPQTSRSAAEDDFEVAKKAYDDFMISYNDRLNKCKCTQKESADRIRALTEEIANEDQLLQLMRVNRSELERIALQDKQVTQDEQTCQKEVKILFDVKFRDILADVALPINPDGMQRVQSSLEDTGVCC